MSPAFLVVVFEEEEKEEVEEVKEEVEEEVMEEEVEVEEEVEAEVRTDFGCPFFSVALVDAPYVVVSKLPASAFRHWQDERCTCNLRNDGTTTL